MDNLKDTTPGIESLDLSGIPGIEEYMPQSTTAETAPDEPIEYEQPAESGSVGDGPISWEKFAEDLPEPLHEQFRPIVDEWSRQYNRVAEEASPYYALRESGFTPEEIEMAANLQRALATDPAGFYEQMGQAYGFAQQQQLAELQQQVQQMRQPAQQADAQPNWWEEDQATAQPQQELVEDPRYAQVEQELEQLRAMQEQFLAQQQLEQGRNEMEYELETIRQKYGDYDEEEVVRRALANYNLEGDASLVRAFHEVKDLEQRIAQRVTAKAKTAPKVMGSASGMPASAPPAPIDTEDARRQAALELAIRMGAAQPGSVR